LVLRIPDLLLFLLLLLLLLLSSLLLLLLLVLLLLLLLLYQLWRNVIHFRFRKISNTIWQHVLIIYQLFKIRPGHLIFFSLWELPLQTANNSVIEIIRNCY
jgi:hypothetical protein